MKALTALLLLLFAGPVRAGGFNIAWDDCGVAGARSKVFSCDTNTGSDLLYASFLAPVPVDSLVGFECILGLRPFTSELPSYWMTLPTNRCRPGAMLFEFDLTDSATNCTRGWEREMSGGGGMYFGPFGLDVARIFVVGTLDHPASIDNQREYFAFRMKFDHRRTVGINACSGCEQPLCIFMNEIKLVQPIGLGDVRIQNPESFFEVAWQSPPLRCPAEVPIRATTWGTIKGLYR